MEMKYLQSKRFVDIHDLRIVLNVREHDGKQMPPHFRYLLYRFFCFSEKPPYSFINALIIFVRNALQSCKLVFYLMRELDGFYVDRNNMLFFFRGKGKFFNDIMRSNR